MSLLNEHDARETIAAYLEDHAEGDWEIVALIETTLMGDMDSCWEFLASPLYPGLENGSPCRGILRGFDDIEFAGY